MAYAEPHPPVACSARGGQSLCEMNPAAAAQQHAEAMASNNFFSHHSLNGATPWDRVRRNGYVARRAAENIAAGATTPERQS